MRIQVRYFAMLREHRGTDRDELHLADGATAADAYAASGCPAGLRVGYAVNEAFVGPDTVLADGDEVAFLPPLGGG